MKKNLFRQLFLIAISISIVACSSDKKNSDEEMLVKIGNQTLTKRDLEKQLPTGLSEEDSTRYARAYINEWINTQLINTIAPKALGGNLGRIEEMVEEYRHQLIANEYRRLREGKILNESVSPDSLKAYYNNHKDRFKLTEPMIKGIYVKTDSSNKNINTIIGLISSRKASDVNELEKNQTRSLIHYDNFRDKWIPWNKIDALIPFPSGNNIDTYLQTGHTNVINNNGFTYILDINEYLPQGATPPFELVRDEISRAIGQDKVVDVFAQMIRELYDEGVKNGQVEIFCDINR